MFTALRRIAKPKNEASDTNRSARPTSMSSNLQKKFSRGVQYNMKIVIKGDKCSGKTSLFRRLQGKNLDEEYQPTEGIQVANVQWNYKNIEDVVKVEVWDVVDKGRKIPFNTGEPVSASLDAEFLDVYKGTNGVILVMDITKNWTFSYVQNEITKIPLNIPVLILGNRCDMGHHQKITSDTVQCFIDSVQRPTDMAQIKYTESSMVNGFGLKYIYKFLALPFLQLQRSALIGQMDRNAEEIQIALQEIDLFQTSDDADYSKFADQLSLKRRKKAEDLGASLKSSDSQRPSVIFGLGCPINRYAPFRKTPQEQLVQGLHQPEGNLHSRTKNVASVEEFMPGGDQLDENFFQDSPSNSSSHVSQQLKECSDSDSQEDANPLVAKFQEDVDPNDAFYLYTPILKKEAPPATENCLQRNCKPDGNPLIQFEGGISTIQPTECAKPTNSSVTAMAIRRLDSDIKKDTEPIVRTMEENPRKPAKKNRKSKGGKHLEGSDAPNDSKSQRKKNEELKRENRSSKNQMKNPIVSQLKA